MVEQTATYILCPGCECSVRLLENGPCPNCRCCAFCGCKLKAEESHCDCTSAKDFQSLEDSLLKEFVIPQEQVARETRRMEIRKQLEMKKTIAVGIPCSMLGVAGTICSDIFGDDTWTSRFFFAGMTMLGIVLCIFVLNRIFKKVEDRYLQSEGFE